jgi:hypothetical protein
LIVTKIIINHPMAIEFRCHHHMAINFICHNFMAIKRVTVATIWLWRLKRFRLSPNCDDQNPFDRHKKPMPLLQGILSIPTHAFATFVQINHFYDFRYDCPLWHLVKLISSRINNYKMVCGYICNLYLWLMLIWIKMKMKMKNTFISSIFTGIPKIDENVIILWLGRWFKGHWTLCGIFSTWFATINPSCKCTCK